MSAKVNESNRFIKFNGRLINVDHIVIIQDFKSCRTIYILTTLPTCCIINLFCKTVNYVEKYDSDTEYERALAEIMSKIN